MADEQQLDPEDSWFRRALDRREAEQDGPVEELGARFNSHL